MNSLLLSYSLFFSCVGIGFFAFGKNRNLYFRISGLLLMVFPYFISNAILLVIIGFVLIVVPFILNWLAPI